MKKKNIRKYILEALAVLLVIGACLTVNDICRREAYADPDDVTFNIKIASPTIKYSDGSTFTGSEVNSYTVKIYEGESPIGSSVTVTKSDAESTDGKDVTIPITGFDGSKTYTIEIDSCSITQGTYSSNSFSGETGYIDAPNKKVSFNLTSVEIRTSDTPPTTVNIKIPSSTVLYSDDSTYTGSEVDSYTVEIKENGVSIGNSISITKTEAESTNGKDVTINIPGFDGTKTYTIVITNCNITQGHYSTTEFSGETGSCDLPNKKISFNLSNVRIKTTDNPKVNLTLSLTGTKTVYYSGKSVVMENEASHITSYNIEVVRQGATTVLARDTVTAGTPKEISFSSCPDGNYTVSVVGCTFNDGLTFKSCSNTANATMTNKTVSFTINNIEIETTASPADRASYSDGSATGDKDNFKISLESDLIKKILKAQTGTKKTEVDNAISEAIASGKKITLKLDIDEGIDSSDKGDIEEEARDSKSGAKTGKTFELKLKLYVGDDYKTDINDTHDNKIKITYTLSDSLKSSSSSSGTRYFRTYYKHNKSIDSASDWEKADSNKITFKASKFSPYAIMYYDDGANSSGGGAANNTSASLPPQGNDPGTAGGTDKSKTPKTGDDFNPRIWIYLLIVCATVASAAWILLQDTREDNEKKQK